MSSDQRQIANLLHRYCELVDTAQFETLGQLMVQCTLLDAEENLIARGKEIGQFYQKIIRVNPDSEIPNTLHVAHGLKIKRSEQDAVCDAKFFVLQKISSGDVSVIISGNYHSEFKLSEGKYQFSKHQITPTFMGDLSEHLYSANLSL